MLDSSIRLKNPDAYFQADFRLFNKVNNYQRAVYNILDAVGDLGGIFSIIYLFGYTIVSVVSEKMYLANLIREVFRVRTDT